MTEKIRRLIQLLGMLGSEHDGEVLNAARLAQRELGAMGVTWAEVINGGAGYAQEAANAGYDRGFREGLTRGKREAEEAARLKRPPNWQTFALTLLHEYRLTEWEIGFCENFVERGWASPTPKQHGVFERIASKFDLDLPDEGQGSLWENVE